jgi:hypothetical protein
MDALPDGPSKLEQILLGKDVVGQAANRPAKPFGIRGEKKNEALRI